MCVYDLKRTLGQYSPGQDLKTTSADEGLT